MSITRDTIERLRNKGEHFIWHLESNNETWIRFKNRDDAISAREVQNSMWGYLQGLRDAGIISETERRVLYNYYATVRGTAKEAEK